MSEMINLIIQSCTLLGIVFGVYLYFRKPDENAENRLNLIEQGCKLKHQVIDDNLLLIKENHLKHIEADIAELKQGQVKILTILEERER